MRINNSGATKRLTYPNYRANVHKLLLKYSWPKSGETRVGHKNHVESMRNM